MSSEANGVLLHTSIFRFVPEQQRTRLEELFKPARYDFGDLIVEQGQPADAFFVLTSGRARVVRTSENGQELPLNMLQGGAEFGESALLEGGVRNASVRCSSQVEVLRLERGDFLKLVEQFPEFKNYLELTARWRALHGFLYQFSNFGRLPAGALKALVEKLQAQTASKGQLILREGQDAGPMFIIRDGRVRIFAGNHGHPRNLAFLREGDFLGSPSRQRPGFDRLPPFSPRP
jgi:CRP-like cAMP-binding protein